MTTNNKLRALISVSDKTGIVSFASNLSKLGFEIISTGGTYKVLKENDIDVIPIDEVTRFPEMLDGRVKTLHPNIHGGLLALRDNPEHMKTCQDHHIDLIALVVVNLYPFEKTIQKPDVTLEEAIENIDIGGPSMIRSASKNYRSVGVVVNPDRYDTILAELNQKQGQLSEATKAELACEAFTHTAEYDSVIAGFLSHRIQKKPKENFPNLISPVLIKKADLRYGENPHQKAAFYELPQEKGFTGFNQLHGKELSYNNIIDLEAAWKLAKEFQIPGVVIIKHTNPCGAAIADSLSEAYSKALEGDPVSAFGSIIGMNRVLDKATAEKVAELFVEAVIAPGFDSEALEILSKKPSIRLIELPAFNEDDSSLQYRYVPGGFLVQEQDKRVVEDSDTQCISKRKPDSREMIDSLFAFSIVKHVKSNAIVVAKDGQVLGVGAGQMSRVDAVENALKKAGSKAKGAVLASDAFFPFKDSVEFAHKAGVKTIIQPGGSKRDQESVDYCDENDLTMILTGIRHFKH